MLDLLITNAEIIDGTGSPGCRADLAVSEGKIAGIFKDTQTCKAAHQTLDAQGMTIAPGFIDIHSHSDFVMPQSNHNEVLSPFLKQGFTTLVMGNCGFSPAPVTPVSSRLTNETASLLRDSDFSYEWNSMKEFLDTIERRGTATNVAFLTGHGTLRQHVMGNSPAPPTSEELDQLSRLVQQSLDDGSVGLSFGLSYAPGVFAKNEELNRLFESATHAGGIVTVHSRAYTWLSPFYFPPFLGSPHNLRSVQEQIALARRTNAKLQLSHLIFVGRKTWPTYPKVLAEIERALDDGVDIAFDAFPYTSGNTVIKVLYPPWFLERFEENLNSRAAVMRLEFEILVMRKLIGIEFDDFTLLWGAHPDLTKYEGMSFTAIAREMKLSPFHAYISITKMSHGNAMIVLDTYSGDSESEIPLEAVLKHRLCAFETDAVLTTKGKHHPGCSGAATRILSRYVRDRKLFSLEEAVRRLTQLPAERIGLKNMGQIREGYFADLVIFDKNKIGDQEDCGGTADLGNGIREVFVSGQLAVQNGRSVLGKKSGRVLRKSG